MNTVNNIADKYLSRLKERCMIDNCQSDLVHAFDYSSNVLSFIVEYPKPKNLKHLTFSRLKEISLFDSDSPISRFKLAIAILTDERVNILIEVFEAHDIESDESITLSFDQISDYMINNKFINPFTEEEISEVNFTKMVTTFFSISDELLGDLNGQ